jgi:hypothetical protein
MIFLRVESEFLIDVDQLLSNDFAIAHCVGVD